MTTLEPLLQWLQRNGNAISRLVVPREQFETSANTGGSGLSAKEGRRALANNTLTTKAVPRPGLKVGRRCNPETEIDLELVGTATIDDLHVEAIAVPSSFE